MPISSPTGAVCCSAWSTTDRSSTPRGPPARRATAPSEPPPGALPSSAALSSYCTHEATRPSRDSWRLPSRLNGLGAAVTFGCSARAAAVPSIAARRPASRSVPDSTAKHVGGVARGAWKRSSNTSSALWDSVPASRSRPTNAPAAAGETPAMRARTATTIDSERFQCPAAAAAIFPRRCAMRRE